MSPIGDLDPLPDLQTFSCTGGVFNFCKLSLEYSKKFIESKNSKIKILENVEA